MRLPSSMVCIKAGAKQAFSKKLAGKDQGLLRSWITGGFWTRSRMASLGYLVDPLCEVCHGEEDTLHHMLYVCPAVASLRNKVVKESFVTRALEAGPSCIKFNRGLCPVPCKLAPAHEAVEDGVVFVNCLDDLQSRKMSGNL